MLICIVIVKHPTWKQYAGRPARPRGLDRNCRSVRRTL